MILRARKYKALETRLGHKFKREELLERALTHSSVSGGKVRRSDNERLEFVGDRVLGLVIAELLADQFPSAREGELAKRFNRLVRRETCAIVGRELGLGEFIILSDSEADSGGRDKDTILADAVEALLAAVFFDAGFETARKTVRRLWDGRNTQAPKVAVDAKSALQEWAQGRGMALPDYVEVSRDGPDHAPRFTTEVRIKGTDPARGSGNSKRHAEQAAAMALLVREGVWSGQADDGGEADSALG